MAVDTDPPIQQATVALTFDSGPPEAVAVQLDDKAIARQKRKARLAEARAYEQLGQRVLKFKARKFGKIGEYIVKTLGVKQVGHGTIISASENADQSIQQCDAIAKELMTRNPPCDPEAIVALMELKRDFNRQLLDAGEAHVVVDRQPNIATDDNKLSIPFPQGTPMVIAMGQKQSPLPPTIEDEPAGQ